MLLLLDDCLELGIVDGDGFESVCCKVLSCHGILLLITVGGVNQSKDDII